MALPGVIVPVFKKFTIPDIDGLHGILAWLSSILYSLLFTTNFTIEYSEKAGIMYISPEGIAGIEQKRLKRKMARKTNKDIKL